MEKFCNAPPPNVFKKPNTFCWFIKSIACLSVNGTGINVPSRKITNINNVKIIFLLISATRIKLEIVRNIKSPQFCRPLLQSPLLQKQRTYELLQCICFEQSLFRVFLLQDRKSTRLNSSHVSISYA